MQSNSCRGQLCCSWKLNAQVGTMHIALEQSCLLCDCPAGAAGLTQDLKSCADRHGKQSLTFQVSPGPCLGRSCPAGRPPCWLLIACLCPWPLRAPLRCCWLGVCSLLALTGWFPQALLAL